VSPITHFLAGWVIANCDHNTKRDRAIIVAASVLPDVDGLSVLIDVARGRSADELEAWSSFHHTLAHNIGFALLVSVIGLLLARRRLPTALLAFFAVHLHLLGDLVGARGPDGYSWPIPYFLPFSGAREFEWSGQWALNAWPNFVITGALIAATLYLAWRRGFSPLELVSARADAAVVNTLRRRFGEPAATVPAQ